ncbi:MAG: HD domain-containing protein [Defluviitaleaceae bacterium]|nr:HD domain-containing protein [Defluviitaleaceae bacterium]
MKSFETWFAGYTAEVRSRISGASFIAGANTEWNWPVADISAVLSEVDLKIDHTYLVRDHCIEIAKWLELSDKDVELAGIIGLFHDLGRFRQAIGFGTMDDRVTGLHGDLSADVFLEEAPKGTLSADDIEVIVDALRYHNLYEIPEGLSERSLLFTQIVRDADKLDIFRFYVDKCEARGFRHIMSEEDGAYSPKMLEGVLRGENQKTSDIQNKNDRKLMQISLVYNMNFGYTFRWMLEKDYLAEITGVADGTADDVMKQVYAYATEWMKERV